VVGGAKRLGSARPRLSGLSRDVDPNGGGCGAAGLLGPMGSVLCTTQNVLVGRVQLRTARPTDAF
jgi:hypothetical protein